MSELIPTGPLFGSLTGAAAEVRAPATGELLATFTLATAEDVAAAAERAAAAQVAWAATSPPERAEVLHRAASLIQRHEDEFVHWGVRETGGIAGKAQHEVHASREELLAAAALATEPYGELVPTGAPRLSYTRRIPYGVVGVIAPWNFPLILTMRAVAPALVLGNAVVLKPDHQTPVFGGALIGRLFEEAGLPAGLLEIVPGGPDTGEAVVADPRIAMISFTGSTAAGRKVGQAAAARMKKVSLELGGNNALIVLDDADVAAATSIGAWGSFFHQGQICLTTGRHLVHRSIAGAYADALADRAAKLRVGDPADPETHIGPLINERQAGGVERIVAESVRAGAVLRTGGTRDGLFYPPTVLTDVAPEMPAFAEEIFGPVAPITVFDDEQEAIRLANATPYGLSAAVVTSAPYRGWKIAERLRAGMVHVNDTTVNDEATSPFGGTGASGNGGRYGGRANWEEFTEAQWITLRDTPAAYPF